MTNLIYSALPKPERPLIFIRPDVSVSECVNMLALHEIGAVIVQNDETTLGVVSERDIIYRCLAKGLNPETTKVIEVAYMDASFLDVNDPLETAMEFITSTKRRHVLITEEGQLKGILSIGDVLFYLLENKAQEIEQLKNYIGTDGICKS